jgi:lysine-N-methylase
MTLPIHTLPIIERWDCHQCGACCRGSLVPLSDDDLARLKAQKWQQRDEFKHTPIIVRDGWLAGGYRLAHRPDGSCVFLMPDGLCRIHKELGFDAKPLICRTFPLQIIPRDNGAYLTLRRACPSAAADRGRPVADQLSFARELAREGHLAETPADAPPIKPGEVRSWLVARRLLQTLGRLLTDEHYPPVRRLVHSVVLTRLLSQAKTRPMTDQRLVELFEVLEQNVAAEAATFFEDRRAPNMSARVLFRQTAADFLRLHPGFIAEPGMRPSWRDRWRLVVAGWKFVRGSGSLPDLHPRFPPVTFEQLEQPLGVLDPAVYQPLARMIETTALSWCYALANRRGWSIVESVWMLALLYPVGLWLLRWRSAGGAPRANHMPEIITALDRGQGFAPLARGKQRRRVRLLAGMDELERLIIWYAR